MKHNGKKSGYVSEEDAIFGDMVTDGKSIYVTSLSNDFTRATLLKYNCANLKCQRRLVVKKKEIVKPFLFNDKIYYIVNYDNTVNLGSVDKNLNDEKYINYDISDNTYKSSNIINVNNVLYFVLYDEEKDSL